MKRRQFIKVGLPAATIGMAGCIGGGSSDGDSGGNSNGGNGGGNQNTRYGVSSCASVDRLVKVRDVIFSYKGLDSRSNMYVYDVKISVKPVGGSDTIYIKLKSATVAGPNGNEIDTHKDTQTYEISTSISDSFEFQVKTDSQFDGEELQVTDVFIQAMTAEEWQSAENGLYGTDNQACY